MGNILGNPIILKKICSNFSLEELVNLNTLCKQTKDIAYYATYTNFINMRKNPDMFFQHLIKNHQKFRSLTMFDFGSRDSEFYYKYIDSIIKIVSLFTIEGLQVFNVSNIIKYIKPEKFKCLITFNFPIEIINYKKLESLVVFNSTNRDLSFIENFQKIRNLAFSNSNAHLYFILPNFNKLKFLSNLSLTNFPVITNTDIQRIISFCSNLTFLNLTNSRIVLVSRIKKMPENKLKKLVLESPFVFDKSVKCFNNSINLKDLTLSGSFVTSSGIMSAVRNSFNLTCLDISMTLINERDLNCICNKLHLLKILHIAKCINIGKFYSIKKLKHLEILSCQSNFIGNRELTSIVKAENKLRLLDISNCNFLTNAFFKNLINKNLKNPPRIISQPNGMFINTKFVDQYSNYHFGI